MTLYGQEVLGSWKDAERSEWRRAAKRAPRNRCRLASKKTSSNQRDDERPSQHRMAKRDRNIGQWRVAGRALVVRRAWSSQKVEQPGGCIIT